MPIVSKPQISPIYSPARQVFNVPVSFGYFIIFWRSSERSRWAPYCTCPLWSLQDKSSSNPRDNKSALFVFGTFVPKITGSSGAGPTMLTVFLLNQSKLIVKRFCKNPISTPIFHERIVSQPNKAETKSGAFDVFGSWLLINHLPSLSAATNFIVWI